MYTNQPAPALKCGGRKLIILPVGSCEQHGPYLPIDTDLRIAGLLAEKLVESFPQTDAVLLPAIPFSCSWEHRGLGTLALNVSTLSAVLHDIAQSLKMWNMPVLLILVNWHGGNDILASVATEITAREAIPTAVIPAAAQVGKAWDESGITDAKDIHAGAVEVSVIQAYWPDIVPRSLPQTAHCEPDIAPAKAQAVLQSIGSYAATRTGIWGAPEQADVKKGYTLIETLVHQMREQTARLLELLDNHYC